MAGLRLLCTVAIAILSTSACTAQSVYSLADLSTALNAGGTKIMIMAPLLFPSTGFTPIVINRTVSLLSPYRAILQFCDAACLNGSVPLKSIVFFNVTTGGSMLIRRCFMRNFLPSAPTDVSGLGPVPGIVTSGSGTLSFVLIVWHFKSTNIWAFTANNSFWSTNSGGMLHVPDRTPLVLDTPDLYAVNIATPAVSIKTCFSPLDVDDCYDVPPDDVATTLVYCPYTTSDSLHNPLIQRVSVFRDTGLDRIAYNYLNPTIVQSPSITYSSCPNTFHTYNLDHVFAGVILNGSITFNNLRFDGSRATDYTIWPQDNPLLLSTFVLSGDGSITMNNCTVGAANMPSLISDMLALPGNTGSQDPAHPNLEPNYGVPPVVNASGFFINSWNLGKAAWLAYTSGNGNLASSSESYYAFFNVTVAPYTPTLCFQSAVSQGSIVAGAETRVTTDLELRTALTSLSSRYVQIMNNITFLPENWPTGKDALVVVPGVVEVRGCPPPGQRLRIDMNNLVGVLRSPGRLIIQGDLDFVNLGWGGMAQASDDSDSPSIVPGFTAVTGTTGATGSVEFEGLGDSAETGIMFYGAPTTPSSVSLVATALGVNAALLPATNMTANTDGDLPFFQLGVLPRLFNNSKQQGTWSFMNATICWRELPEASAASRMRWLGVEIGVSIGAAVLLAGAGLLLFLAIRHRSANVAISLSKRSLGSSADYEKGIMGSRAGDPGKQNSPSEKLKSGSDAKSGLGSRSTIKTSLSGPTGDIHAARRSLVNSCGLPHSEEELVLQSILGEGSYGKVYRALWKGTSVAVKIIVLPANMTGREKHEKMAVMETAISSSLSHPNIVQTFTYSVEPIQGNITMGAVPPGGSCLSLPNNTRSKALLLSEADGLMADMVAHSWEVRIVQEFCEHGSLRDALSAKLFQKGELHVGTVLVSSIVEDRTAGRTNPTPQHLGSTSHTPARHVHPLADGRPNLVAVLDCAIDVSRAMAHLHAEHIIHSDLKPRNVLLKGSSVDSRGFVAKVADFGLSVRIDPMETHISNSFQGTVTHMAPEILMKGRLSKSSDVYSFGILLWELYTGGHAFKDVPMALLGHSITKGNQRPRFPADAPFDLTLLACRCWESQPEIRPEFEAVLSELKRMRARLDEPSSSAASHSSPDTSKQLWGLPLCGATLQEVDDEEDEGPSHSNGDAASHWNPARAGAPASSDDTRAAGGMQGGSDTCAGDVVYEGAAGVTGVGALGGGAERGGAAAGREGSGALMHWAVEAGHIQLLDASGSNWSSLMHITGAAGGGGGPCRGGPGNT
ncbi:MAG: hypothetical protein WDW36_001371 [Sanguina aurantia]